MLRLGLLKGAEAALRRCVRASLYDPETRASVLYDRACVAARGGRPDNCRAWLGETLRLAPGLKSEAARDPDFEAVRGEAWFRSQTLGDHSGRDDGANGSTG